MVKSLVTETENTVLLVTTCKGMEVYVTEKLLFHDR
jgi:hypothetical protein